MPGIGTRELRQILIAVIPAVIFTFLYWIFQDNPASRLLVLLGLILYIATCYAVFSCPDGGQSIYIYISRWVRYLRTQQTYKYQQEPEVLRYHVKRQEQ